MRAGGLTAGRRFGGGVLDLSGAEAAGQSREAGGPGARRTVVPWLVPLLAAFDLLAVVAAYALAFVARVWLPVPLTAAELPAELAWQLHAALLLLLATQLPLLYVFGLYDLRLLRERVSPLLAPLGPVLLQLLAVTGFYFFRGEIAFPRSVLLLYAAADVLLLGMSRLAARRVLRAVGAVARIALVGPPGEVAELHAELAAEVPRQGIAIVGAVRPAGVPAAAAVHARVADAAAPDEVRLRWLGSTRDLARLAREHRIDQLVVVPGATGGAELLDAVLRAHDAPGGPRVALVPSVYELHVGRLASLRIDDVPLIELVREPRTEIAFRLKAVFDYVLATGLLVLGLPLCLLAAVAIRASSRGPVLYRQRRVGRAGQEFIMYKLRTMRDDAEMASGPVLASDGDARVTGPGRLLRATRVDEIPQLLNVLNGTMSLVGPRPERPEFAERLAAEIPGYRERWLVKPGLTGLAQVHGEYHTSPAYKLKYDLAYIHNYALSLDLRILAETLKTLVTRRGV